MKPTVDWNACHSHSVATMAWAWHAHSHMRALVCGGTCVAAAELELFQEKYVIKQINLANLSSKERREAENEVSILRSLKVCDSVGKFHSRFQLLEYACGGSCHAIRYSISFLTLGICLGGSGVPVRRLAV